MLQKRVLRVTLEMPGGDVVLNEELDLRIRIKKAALALQNRASIVVFGMSRTLREQLLSQFTAWNKRVVEEGLVNQKWIKVHVDAGYTDAQGKTLTATAFRGEVAIVELISTPPDIGVNITCYTRQIDKTTFITDQPPSQTTLSELIKWSARQLELGDPVIETQYADTPLDNPFIGFQTRAGIVWALQDTRKSDIVAFIDDDLLVVKDRQRVINPSEIVKITEFVGVPSWDEYGVQFTTLFDTSIRLAHAADLTSLMNPSINGQYVLTVIEYDLTSRDTAFYVNAYGSPPST